MNVEGDFRYADPGAFEECIDFIEYLEEHDQNWEEAFVEWVHVSEIWKEDRRASQRQKQKGIAARSSLLNPGGLLSCELGRHGVILKVDDWVFCHGGLLPHHGKACCKRCL
ncbi:hypothetical protein KSP39_PZI013840 [Platanthera zijinensis]|uniref:Uncharacterized protein n=1 Tax=Platanthera zijinensis TaxID=2320716 RepID=A0AAP0BCN9_9ASPA